MNNNLKEVFKSKVVNNVHALNKGKIPLPHRLLALSAGLLSSAIESYPVFLSIFPSGSGFFMNASKRHNCDFVINRIPVPARIDNP